MCLQVVFLQSYSLLYVCVQFGVVTLRSAVNILRSPATSILQVGAWERLSVFTVMGYNFT